MLGRSRCPSSPRFCAPCDWRRRLGRGTAAIFGWLTRPCGETPPPPAHSRTRRHPGNGYSATRRSAPVGRRGCPVGAEVPTGPRIDLPGSSPSASCLPPSRENAAGVGRRYGCPGRVPARDGLRRARMPSVGRLLDQLLYSRAKLKSSFRQLAVSGTTARGPSDDINGPGVWGGS